MSHSFRFKAFISYSHADKVQAQRLQRALERYKVDNALVGLPTLVGRVPETLAPIFRDETDLVASGSLDASLRAALDDAKFLIVLCSPHSVKSEHVASEIEYFRRLGRSSRILALVIGEDHGQPIADFFPAALTAPLPAGAARRSEGDGEDSSTEPQEPLAVDARGSSRRRWSIAILQIASALIGLPLDRIIRPIHKQRVRERRVWGYATLGLVGMSGVAAGLAMHNHEAATRTERLFNQSVEKAALLFRKTRELTSEQRITASAAAELLEHNEKLFLVFSEYKHFNASSELRRARMLIDVAAIFAKLDQGEKQSRYAELALEAIDWLSSHEQRSEEALTVRAEAYRVRGDARYGASRFQDALQDYDRGLVAIEEVNENHVGEGSPLGAAEYVLRSRLMLARSALLTRIGRKPEALDATLKSLRMGETLTLDQTRAQDREALDQLVVAHYRAGDLLRQLNDPRKIHAADRHYAEGMRRAEQLLELYPHSAHWRQRVAMLHLGRGDFERWRGNRTAALENYRKNYEHRRDLRLADPTDSKLAEAYGFSLIKRGEELNAVRRAQEAIPVFEEAEKVYSNLRSRGDDRRYRFWELTAVQGIVESHVLISRSKSGGAKAQMSDAGIEALRRKLNLAHRHYEANGRTGIDALRMLAEAYRDLGTAYASQAIPSLDGFGAGIQHLTIAREHLQPVVDREDADWITLRNQASIFEALARARLRWQRTRGDPKTAMQALSDVRSAAALRDREAGKKPLDVHGRAELAENKHLLGEALDILGACKEARASYQDAVSLLDKLVQLHDRPDLAWLEKYRAVKAAFAASRAFSDGAQACAVPPVGPVVREMIAMVRELLS